MVVGEQRIPEHHPHIQNRHYRSEAEEGELREGTGRDREGYKETEQAVRLCGYSLIIYRNTILSAKLVLLCYEVGWHWAGGL